MMATRTAKRVSDSQFRTAVELADLGGDAIEPTIAKVAASEYLDAEVFDRETRNIFGRMPVPVALSAELERPQSYRALRLAGRSILLTRDSQGEVRAFFNTCRHRGMRLVAEGESACRGRITCPYHAWSYRLDGSLDSVPREEVFSDLDKLGMHLAPVPCREAGGFVWVSLDESQELTEARIGEDLVTDFDAIGIAGMRVYACQDEVVPANWKLIADAFLEGYHVIRLHAATLARFFEDAPQANHRMGQHVRQSSGSRKGFAEASISKDWEEFRKSVTFSYHVFPGVILVTSPTYVSVVLLQPVAVDQTRARFVMLVENDPADERAESRNARSYDLMSKAFGEEDYWAAAESHAGLKNESLDALTIGGMETAIRMFHDIVEEARDAKI